MRSHHLLSSLLLLLVHHQLLQSPAPVAAQSLKRSVDIKQHETYRDFVPLSAANLTRLAMRDDQAWVIHVHDGFIEPEVKHRAAQVRGLVRFGLVSVEDKEAIELMKFNPTQHFFRSLPFGWESRKLARFMDTESFASALEHAADSVPRDFLTVVKTEKDTKALLAEAIASRPSRFTVLFNIAGTKPTLLQRVLSRKLIRNFNFALLPNADSPEAAKAAGLAGLTLPSPPGMSVLTVTKTGGVRATRGTGTTSAKSDGGAAEMEFADALRFLVNFNRQFRADLPGDARSSDRLILSMSDVLDAERLIFEVIDDEAEKGGEKRSGEDLKEEL